ncbi:MerR family DNA-binding transcriptional regulator [Novosphingobium sp. G106]|uniref:MerR family DNA-binding transcriptional regulator n=1 Tax=Novosphingobium sp. G106 TaxID=2849500 RepID=UPI002811CAA8|nr:MerR family DNA-binding transcriptional regulator [Novosphingobium sp. G106]
MKLIEISEVAKRSGITASTLRFYEEKGLIESLGRRGLRRTYGQDVFGRLSLVTLGRLAGFSLDQISAMFGSGPSAQIDRVPLSDKAAELDRTIRQLNALKKWPGARRHLSCTEPHGMPLVPAVFENRGSALWQVIVEASPHPITLMPGSNGPYTLMNK